MADATSENTEIIQWLAGRSSTYRLISRLYFLPLKQEEIDQIVDSGLDASAFEEGLCQKGIQNMAGYLRRLNSGTRQELAVDFTSSFGGAHTWEDQQALPYRSLFMDGSERLLFAEGHTQAFEVYKSMCLKRREGLDYPDDHLTFMCEFMAIMSDRAAAALAEGDSAAAEECLAVSRDFLQDQVLSWFDKFQGVALHIIETRFYRGVLDFTKGYFFLDLELLNELLNDEDIIPSDE